jgi:hypothetical protein
MRKPMRTARTGAMALSEDDNIWQGIGATERYRRFGFAYQDAGSSLTAVRLTLEMVAEPSSIRPGWYVLPQSAAVHLPVRHYSRTRRAGPWVRESP